MDIQGLIQEGTFPREYRKCSQDSSLNPAIAYALNQLAGLDEKDRILDPCCGTGTILIERQLLKPCISVGVDINPKSLACAQENIKAAFSDNKIVQLKHGNIIEQKFPNGYFTKIISNLPFGVHSGSRENNIKLYRFLADESHNWLRSDGKAVFFTQAKTLLKKSFEFSGHWDLIDEISLELGGLTPSIFVFQKR
jgi:tRNA (guanine6-N2)-methyltransferase